MGHGVMSGAQAIRCLPQRLPRQQQVLRQPGARLDVQVHVTAPRAVVELRAKQPNGAVVADVRPHGAADGGEFVFGQAHGREP